MERKSIEEIEKAERARWERMTRHLRSLGKPLKFMPPATEKP